MGKRLSKIYTRTGDAGETGLGTGERVPKDAPRVEAYGTVDELNSALGLVLAEGCDPAIQTVLTQVQHTLFDLGGELCLPGQKMVDPDDVEYLEQQLDDFNQHLPALDEFILPGGGRSASAAHLARCICRRAERRCVTLARSESVGDALLAYLNRLSDLLFVLCRVLARQDGKGEVLWQHERRRPENND